MDMGGEMDDGVNLAQRRRPIGLRADVADEAVLDVGDRRLPAGPTLRKDEAMARHQHGKEGAADEAARASDEDLAHGAIILKRVGAA